LKDGLSYVMANVRVLNRRWMNSSIAYGRVQTIHQLIHQLIFNTNSVTLTMVAATIMAILLAMISTEHEFVDDDVVSYAHFRSGYDR
jgi:hypothetical protein